MPSRGRKGGGGFTSSIDWIIPEGSNFSCVCSFATADKCWTVSVSRKAHLHALLRFPPIQLQPFRSKDKGIVTQKPFSFSGQFWHVSALFVNPYVSRFVVDYKCFHPKKWLFKLWIVITVDLSFGLLIHFIFLTHLNRAARFHFGLAVGRASGKKSEISPNATRDWSQIGNLNQPFFGRKLPIRDIAIHSLWISDSHHIWKLNL